MDNGILPTILDADSYVQIKDLLIGADFGGLTLHLDNLLGGGDFGEAINNLLNALGHTIWDLVSLNPVAIPLWVVFSACGGIRTGGNKPVLVQGILGKGGLFVTLPLEDCPTGPTAKH